jgi:hypothetical protein
MQQEPLEYAKVSRVFSHDPDSVWRHAGDFGGIAGWVQGVLSCEVNGEGIGAIRTVTMKGRQVRERLAGLDPIQRVIAYQILPPHSLPATDILSTIQVLEFGTGSSEVTWRSQAVFDGDVGNLPQIIEAFFMTSLDNLHRLLDGKV